MWRFEGGVEVANRKKVLENKVQLWYWPICVRSAFLRLAQRFLEQTPEDTGGFSHDACFHVPISSCMCVCMLSAIDGYERRGGW